MHHFPLTIFLLVKVTSHALTGLWLLFVHTLAFFRSYGGYLFTRQEQELHFHIFVAIVSSVPLQSLDTITQEILVEVNLSLSLLIHLPS